MAKNISFTVKYWKQNGPKDAGHFEQREMKNIPDDTSFLEMLDILNEELINDGKEPFVFDHDCREGICGMCSLYINGTPHGKTAQGATTCQLYMRRFNDGDVITVEPWRSAAFPVIKDCMVDRTAFDKIQAAGGYTSIRTGQAQDANAILIPKPDADEATRNRVGLAEEGLHRDVTPRTDVGTALDRDLPGVRCHALVEHLRQVHVLGGFSGRD